MRQKLLLLLFTILTATLPTYAYDFMFDGLCYNRNADGTSVTVTYQSYQLSSNYSSLSGAITIPEIVTNSGTTYSVTSIGDCAFEYCSGLTSVTIPNSVTSIGSGAFYGCSGLTSVTIPNSVTSIGGVAFSGCSGLTGIKVESGNTKYDSRNNCNAIIETATNTLITGCKTTTIPKSVISISDYAFYGCSGLTSVTIPNSVTSIGGGAFSGCSGLTSVTIPNSVISISAYAFSGCSGLTSVTIPNSVTSIGIYAFYNCSGLTSVTIGSAVSSIGSYAFSCYTDYFGNYYSNIETIISLNPTPPSIDYNTFGSYNAILYVPTPDKYKSPSNWKKFRKIVEFKNILLDCNYTKVLLKPYIAATELKLISAVVNGKTFKPASDGTITLSGLQPNTNYTATVKYTEKGEQKQADIEFTTQDVLFNLISIKTTQTTAEITYKVARDAGLVVRDFYVKLGGTNYPATITETTDDYYSLKCTITGLTLNNRYTYNPAITYNGVEYSLEGNYSFITSGANISTKRAITPTTATITADFNNGDAKLKAAYFTYYGTKYDKLSLTGLKPSTSYSATYTVETESGSQSQSISFTTPELTMTTQAAKMLDNRTPLLMAETNIADEETSCGFEWRRYDAPAEMPSTMVYCPVYDGIMSGTIRNMTENVYYKYRPFYKASDGTMYYGDWIAFITADAGIYFDPLVHTYAEYLLDTEAGSATITGVAIRGSETISEQGFEYWWSALNSAPQYAPSAVTKVKATGERMSVTLSDLQAGRTYSYRSYVISESGTFYGETRSFNIPRPAVNGDLNGDQSVNAGDVSVLYQMITSGEAGNGDLNGDGQINAADVSALYRLMLK